MFDQYLMREARNWGIKVLSIILSWDNTTTHGMAAAVSDMVIAWTENMKKEFVGEEIRGKKLSIIGLGAIGSMVAEQAINLGMKVKAYDPGLTVDVALGLPSSLEKCDSMESCLEDADYVSLHIPLNSSTHY